MAQAATRRGRSAKAPLSEDAVVDAGLRVLQRSGLAAVTMRAVAQELDTGAASLYVYVGGRDDLYRLMFDRVAGLIDYPTPDPKRWREQLRTLCLHILEALEAHPGIASVAMGHMPLGPNAMDGAEAMMALLLAGGIEPRRAAFASDGLFLLATANAVETIIRQERAGVRDAPIDTDALRANFRDLPAERYPTLAANQEVMVGGEDRERFLFAIDTFIAGLTAG